jgi:hypothetical protein
MGLFLSAHGAEDKGVPIALPRIGRSSALETFTAPVHAASTDKRFFVCCDRLKRINDGTMSELKTKETDDSVEAYLAAIDDRHRREECQIICDMMRDVTGLEPKMWGADIVGFGSYHYKYATGREGDWFVTGFSSRKQNISLYVMAGFSKYPELMETLGRYKTGKSCLYIKRTSDVDMAVLRKLIELSVRHMNPFSASQN